MVLLATMVSQDLWVTQVQLDHLDQEALMDYLDQLVGLAPSVTQAQRGLQVSEEDQVLQGARVSQESRAGTAMWGLRDGVGREGRQDWTEDQVSLV